MKWIAITLVLVLSASARHARAAAFNDEARAVANAMVHRFVDWADAELVDPSGQVFEGRSAIVRTHEDIWRGIFRGTRQKAVIRRITVLAPTVIVVDLDLELAGVHGLPPGAPGSVNHPLKSHLKQIMQKRGATWKVLLARNTFYK